MGTRFYASVTAAVVLISSAPVYAAGITPPTTPKGNYVAGELLIQVKGANNTLNSAVAIASGVGAHVVRSLPVKGWYEIKANIVTPDATDRMMSALSADSRIVRSEPNYYCQILATPNDTYWLDQWNMRMVRAEEAWNIQKGSSDVAVAVIDTGVVTSHPDLSNRLLPGYDVGSDDADPNPPLTCEALDNDSFNHGTLVAGIIAAQGNNALGVTGVCWDNVKIIPIKACDDQQTQFPVSNGVRGLDEALNRGAVIANCSWGAGVPSAILEAKVTEVSNAGMLVVAAAGNDNGPIIWPAVYDDCIAVGSVGPTQLRASYSNFGRQLDIVAPGGDVDVTVPNTNDPGWMLSTSYFCTTTTGQDILEIGWQNVSGTSFAAPMVSGALALLMSNGKTSIQARRALLASAKQRGIGVPNNQYGYGILDCYAALTYVPTNVSIEKPRTGDIVSTLKPLIRVNLGGISAQSVIVTIDGVPVINGQSSTNGRVGDFSYNQTAGSMVFSYLFDTEGSHRIAVSATSANDSTKKFSASSNFRIKGLALSAGLHFISRPYPAPSTDPQVVLGTPLYRLARAVTTVEDGIPVLDYALYNYPGLTDDPRASFKPIGIAGGEVGGSDDTLPRGLGYWLTLLEPVTLLGTEYTDDSHTFDVFLSSGWNQIGNPYPFPIALTTLTATYQSETLNMTDAVKRGWISGSIYSYKNGAYVVESLPGAILQPWVGYWLRSRVPLTGAMSSDNDPRGVVKLNFVPLQASQAILPGVTAQ